MGCCLKARGNTKARGRGKKLLLAQITHSFKLTMLNVHHVTVCMKCEQNILELGIPPPIILSLTIFSVAAIFRSLHGSRVRSHCICASVRPAGSPPVSQIVILKTLFSFWRVEQAVGSQTVHVASENWFGEAKKKTPGMQCDSGLFIGCVSPRGLEYSTPDLNIISPSPELCRGRAIHEAGS